MHNMDGGHFFDWGHGTGMIIWWIVVIVIISAVIALLVRQGHLSKNEPGTPLDIAKKRYANGEINKEEFEQIKKDLL